MSCINDSFKLLLIIPCFNESKRLNSSEFLNYLSQDENTNYLFVNDGSTDNTLEVLKGLESKNSDRIKVLSLEQNSGKAEAVRQGLSEGIKLRYEALGYWDADLATPLQEILSIRPLFKSTHSIVICARWNHLGADINRKLTRHYLGRIFATLASLILNLSVYDTQCGAKIFRRSVLQNILEKPFLSKWFFDVEILKRCLNEGIPVSSMLEYPVSKWEDVSGSKLKIKDFFKAPFELLKIYFNY